MNLYKISQHSNNGWDTYDSAVVVARDESEAQRIHPDGRGKKWWDLGPDDYYSDTWCSHPDQVSVTHIGKCRQELKLKEGSIICASFNAG